jgi:hypothetical protein
MSATTTIFARETDKFSAVFGTKRGSEGLDLAPPTTVEVEGVSETDIANALAAAPYHSKLIGSFVPVFLHQPVGRPLGVQGSRTSTIESACRKASEYGRSRAQHNDFSVLIVERTAEGSCVYSAEGQLLHYQPRPATW